MSTSDPPRTPPISGYVIAAVVALLLLAGLILATMFIPTRQATIQKELPSSMTTGAAQKDPAFTAPATTPVR